VVITPLSPRRRHDGLAHGASETMTAESRVRRIQHPADRVFHGIAELRFQKIDGAVVLFTILRVGVNGPGERF